MPGFLVFYIKRNTTDKQYSFQIYTLLVQLRDPAI